MPDCNIRFTTDPRVNLMPVHMATVGLRHPDELLEIDLEILKAIERKSASRCNKGIGLAPTQDGARGFW